MKEALGKSHGAWTWAELFDINAGYAFACYRDQRRIAAVRPVELQRTIKRCGQFRTPVFTFDQYDGIRRYTQIASQQRTQRCALLRPVITKTPYMNLVFAQFSRNIADIRALIRSHAGMLTES